MATHSSILASKIPWTEKSGRLHPVHGVTKSWTRLKQLSTRTAQKSLDCWLLFPMSQFCYCNNKQQLPVFVAIIIGLSKALWAAAQEQGFVKFFLQTQTKFLLPKVIMPSVNIDCLKSQVLQPLGSQLQRPKILNIPVRLYLFLIPKGQSSNALEKWLFKTC